MSIRLVLADDQPAVRAGLRGLLERTDDISVVGEARDGAEAIDMAARLRPDVVLMDVRMPGVDGITATRSILGRDGGSGTRILVLTTFGLDEYVFAALQAGASGFLLKNVAPTELRRAIRVVAAGQALLDPTVTRRVIARFAETPGEGPRPTRLLDQLTEREYEVALLVAAGLSNDEISRELVLSEWTVKTHVRHILAKLQARDRVQVVIAVHEAGVAVPRPDPSRKMNLQ